MAQATGNMKENNCRTDTIHKQKTARNDRQRYVVPMVVYRRQDKISGAFLLLNRYRTGLKAGEELPSSSRYPIAKCIFKTLFQFIKINHFGNLSLVSESTINNEIKKGGIIFIFQVVSFIVDT
jgi:hypothetical protein